MGELFRKYWILIAIALVGELGIAILIYTWVSAPAPQDEDAVVEEVAEEIGPVNVGEPTAVYDKLEPVVVNPAGVGGSRYLSVEVVLMLDAESTIPIIEDWDPKIYDSFVNILSQKYIHELDEAHELDSLKAELKEGVNKVLPVGHVVEVGIHNLLIQ